MKRGIFLLLPAVSAILFAQAQCPNFPPGRSGVEEMLLYVLNANEESRLALTDSLEPRMADYDSVFETGYAKKVFKQQRYLQRVADIIVKPLLREQTDYLLWEATQEDLLNLKGEAHMFPGGYHEFATHFKPNLTFYRFKFVEPGRKLGSAFDVLVFVNGHWRIFHRPWAVMKIK